MSCVALTYAVARVEVTLPGLTHCTTEHGRMFVPVTVKATSGLPTAAEVCESEPFAGTTSAVAGVESVKGIEFDVPSEFVTDTPALPGNAALAAAMAAVSCVALTNVVGCAAPFQFTTASLVKFVPLTESVKP